jgi:DNA-binding transcriptional LysR family regulator
VVCLCRKPPRPALDCRRCRVPRSDRPTRHGYSIHLSVPGRASVADRDSGLVRVQDRIEPLDAPHWLIVHRDLRRLPVIRAAMDWIAHIFAANRSILEGTETTSKRQAR